ncbi:MAG: hypothetical protein EAX95_12825 [Candidatus Thorarchaeota archaeon]|nr:hypothetical protein [Candidatus Thorarchaeota archaeon]
MFSATPAVGPAVLQAAASASSNAPDDTIIWEIEGSPYSLDPHINYESFGEWVIYNVYETLYTYSWDSSSTEPSIPLLAAGPPSISPDGLNYTIVVRENVTFHDGTPFNASCVQWNVYRAAKVFYFWGPFWMIAEPLLGGAYLESVAYSYNSDSPEYAQAFDEWVALEPVQVLDNYTIRFRLEAPYVPFIAALTYFIGAIMSPTFALAHTSNPAWSTWDSYGVDYGEWPTYMHDHMCGTGPYMIQEWVPNQYVLLRGFSDYWRSSTDPSPSRADYVLIRTNEDSGLRMSNLEDRIIDGCDWPISFADRIWDSGTQTSLNPNVTVSTGEASYVTNCGGYNMGLLNTSEGTMIGSPYQNANFRKASSYLFNYDAFIAGAAYGFAVAPRGPIPIGMWGHNGSSYPYEFNLTAAVEFWNAAVTDSAFVNSLHLMDDTLNFYYYHESAAREQMCLYLKDGLEQVFARPSTNLTAFPSGITVNAQPLEWSTYGIYLYERKLLVYSEGWTPDFADPSNYVLTFGCSSGLFPHRNGYINPTIDILFALQLGEHDLEQRQYYLSVIQEELNQDCPYLWTIQKTEFRTWAAWLAGDGMLFNPMHNIYFHHVAKTASTTTTTTTATTTTTSTTSTTSTTTSTDLDLLITIVLPLAGGFVVTIVIGLIYFRRKGLS